MSQLFFDLCQVANTKLKFFETTLIKFKSCLNKSLSMKTIYLALSQKKQNKIVYYVLSYNFKTYSKIPTSDKFHF